jgi:hypothetical protein
MCENWDLRCLISYDSSGMTHLAKNGPHDQQLCFIGRPRSRTEVFKEIAIARWNQVDGRVSHFLPIVSSSVRHLYNFFSVKPRNVLSISLSGSQLTIIILIGWCAFRLLCHEGEAHTKYPKAKVYFESFSKQCYAFKTIIDLEGYSLDPRWRLDGTIRELLEFDS